MKLSILCIILLGSIGYSQSQPKESKPYIARILLANGEKVKGILYATTEDAVTLLDKNNKETNISPADIQWIKVRRKGRIGRGVLIGGASGGLLGGIFAAVAVDNNPIIELIDEYGSGTGSLESEATFELILGGAVVGAATGALIASKSDRFIIRGNRENYISQLTRLQLNSQTKLKIVQK